MKLVISGIFWAVIVLIFEIEWQGIVFAATATLGIWIVLGVFIPLRKKEAKEGETLKYSSSVKSFEENNVANLESDI
jgi:hypothetical protein